MSDLVTTRLSLHAVAELLLAGPQFRQHRTIKLRVTPGGFGTVQPPEVRVNGTALVVADRSVSLDGRTVADLADQAGLATRPLDDVYTGGCGLTTEHLLSVDADATAEIAEAFRRGQEAMTALAPEAERVLWPEHFDLGISLDQVNYGLSAGDSYLPVPYAYVGPWTPGEFTGAFWNAPFGAARPVDEIEDLVGFYAEGQSLTLAN
jgi:hypothetical protein